MGVKSKYTWICATLEITMFRFTEGAMFGFAENINVKNAC